jgi:aminobenzoyl-glutamate utilization protein B
MDAQNPAFVEIMQAVEAAQEKYWRISDAIWSYAELGLEEFRSSKLLADTLEEAGFTVERGVAGMPTAFIASWSQGAGKPVIGFLAEYDALPMLSQKAGSPVQYPVVPGAPGHGCGHNAMGSMQALAVTVLKDYLQRKSLDCTLKYYGCPAEEMLVPRPYMIRAGLFKDVDVVIDCHSGARLATGYGISGAAMYSFTVSFRGKTSHSGANPWNGRSATDAVELMHAGTERMREHVPPTARIHWVTQEGGEFPNVVPDRASTWYFVRDIDANVEADFKWILDCAKAAALMTQTTYEVKVLAACHQAYRSKALAELMYENIKLVGKPEYTEEEQTFARALQKNMGVEEKGLDYTLDLANAATLPYNGGSTDVGDVSMVAPLASVSIPTVMGNFPGHHWAVVTSGISSFAHKGITAAARVACLTAYDLLAEPELLAGVKKEFAETSQEYPYKTFLPEDAQPPVGWNAALMAKYRPEMEKYYIALR